MNREVQLSEAFRNIRAEAGVTKRLHDARHAAATQLLGTGVDVVTTAAIIGHSTAATTLNVYGHVIQGHKDAGMAKYDAHLRGVIERSRKGKK